MIDSKGHLRLTDFGLSRMGFIGRRSQGLGDVLTQSIEARNKTDGASSYDLPQSPILSNASINFPAASPLAHISFPKSHHRKHSSASIASMRSISSQDGSHVTHDSRGEGEHRFLGTPDYLAPECILGVGQDTPVDWVCF